MARTSFESRAVWFRYKSFSRQGFTLIELLVVIAIIAILAVVVVLALNPAELLRQSRDANRVSDMATLTSAINLYSTDQSGASSFSLGSSSVVYVSLPDPAATSTAGSNCASLGLLTLPSTYTYHCAGPNYYRNINGTGWIPINFSTMSTGAPISNLPVDPTNTSSSRLYYTYTTNGSQFEVTATMESSKYQLGGSNDKISGDGSSLATVYAKGSNLAIEPLDYGDPALVAYWPLNEGIGTIAYDESGSGDYGRWYGTQAGSSTYYGIGVSGGWAGYFNGSNDYFSAGDGYPAIHNFPNGLSMSVWVDPMPLTGATTAYIFMQSGGPTIRAISSSGATSTEFAWGVGGSIAYSPYYPVNTWYQVVGTYAVGSRIIDLYVNGTLVASTTMSGSQTSNPNSLFIGEFMSSSYFSGLMSNMRRYDAVYTPAQVTALYNGNK